MNKNSIKSIYYLINISKYLHYFFIKDLELSLYKKAFLPQGVKVENVSKHESFIPCDLTIDGTGQLRSLVHELNSISETKPKEDRNNK